MLSIACIHMVSITFGPHGLFYLIRLMKLMIKLKQLMTFLGVQKIYMTQYAKIFVAIHLFRYCFHCIVMAVQRAQRERNNIIILKTIFPDSSKKYLIKSKKATELKK